MGTGSMSKTALVAMLALAIVTSFGSNRLMIGDYFLTNEGIFADGQSIQFEHILQELLGTTSTGSNSSATELPFAKKRRKAPSKFFFQGSFVRFLHMGKAGGGTVAARIREVWRLQMSQCHPSPCVNQRWNEPGIEHPILLISLRDPVERFVSAFYWRILRLCHPEVDQRTERPASVRRDLCQNDRRDAQAFVNETQVLFYRYNQNASLLAEDLCSTNSTTAQIARESLGTIWHAQHGIVDWLDFAWNASRVFPLVVEAGAEDLEDQIDNSMYWLFNVSHFQKESGFERRAAFVQTKKQPKNKHTSHKAQQPLTEQAEKCLEKYYRKDYEILKQLLDSACKTEGCRQAIQSILDRREHVFKESVPADSQD